MQPVSTSLRRPAGRKRRHMINVTMKINSAFLLLSKLCNSKLLGVPNNSCDLIRMLNVDVGVVLVNNILKILQRQSVLQIQSARSIPTFLLSNARVTLLFQKVSPAFSNNARSPSNARPLFYRLQNARPMFYLSQNMMLALLILNVMVAFQYHVRSAFQ